MSFQPLDPDPRFQQRLSELEAEKNNIIRNSTARTFELPEIFKYDFDKSTHPWNKKESDITDYFNYGYNEETWKLYVNKVRKMALNLNPTEYKIDTEALPDSQTLNELDDEFPIDLGGFSNPFYNKEMMESLGENFFDDKILAHCVGRKKYGNLDYDNINLDHYLNYFLNDRLKMAGSQTFEKMMKFIKMKNSEHFEDIYQIKSHLQSKPKPKLMNPWVPAPPPFPGRFPHPYVMPPPYPSGPPMFPPYIKPPSLLPPFNLEDYIKNGAFQPGGGLTAELLPNGPFNKPTLELKKNDKIDNYEKNNDKIYEKNEKYEKHEKNFKNDDFHKRNEKSKEKDLYKKQSK